MAATVSENILRPSLTRAVRPTLRTRDHVITSLLATWTMIGIFIDGWAHSNLDSTLETFFTPWHAMFYSGFAATALWMGYQVLRRQPRTGRFDVSAVPLGYGFGIVGLCVFAVGGIGDMLWHTIFGIEVGLDALLSPTHLLLFVGLLLVQSSPVRAEWARAGHERPSFKQFSPVLISLTMIVANLSFLTMYLSPFQNYYGGSEFVAWASSAPDPFTSDFVEASQVLGFAGVLFGTILMIGPVLYALRRWHLPFGTLTVMFTAVAALLSAVESFELDEPVYAALVAGLIGDMLIAKLRPSPTRRGAFIAVATLIPLVLWSAYFGVLGADQSLGWVAELWTGSIVLGAMTGAGVGLLLSPQALPEPQGLEARV